MKSQAPQSVSPSKRQVGPFEQSDATPDEQKDSEMRLKFAANNFLTPRVDNEEAKVPSPNKQTLQALAEVSSSTVTCVGQAPPNIQIQKADDDEEEEKADFAPADEGDETMQEYVEELLSGQLMAGRRSSNRINSLLYEEDSMQIKREMLRQKQEK